jgi:hypothetical protein
MPEILASGVVIVEVEAATPIIYLFIFSLLFLIEKMIVLQCKLKYINR